MKHRVLSTVLALCMCIPAVPTAHAWQDPPPMQEKAISAVSAAAPYAEVKVPTQTEAYNAMMALESTYPEGMEWTDASSGTYYWNGGRLPGNVTGGTGCVAFAFRLSDAAFGNLPARVFGETAFTFEDVKVGDILRVNGGSHTVIVTGKTDAAVVLAEGNYNGKIHWGRTLTKTDVEAAYQYITRYPAGYDPDDPSVNEPIENGTGTVGSLNWTLTGAGTLTISGTGEMPDNESPWSQFNDRILNVVIENGVTKVGAGAFRGSKVISATIPSSVKTIGGSAFRSCPGLVSVTVSEGVETIGDHAFGSCAQLKSIVLPASVREVGAAAFFQCTELMEAIFASGSNSVILGDNLFTNCWKLTAVILPQKADKIGTETFKSCLLLTSLNIPEGVTIIGERAFSSCGMLTKVAIPDSVTEIGIAAFSDCPKLNDIYYAGDEAKWAAISKLGDSASTLAGKTIHYGSTIPEPDPGPDNPGTDPDPDPDPGDHTHAWGSGVVTRPASCTSSGIRTYTCECGETKTETIAALGHRYGSGVVTKPASCTEEGVRTYTSSRCGRTKTETIAATDHSYSGFVVTKEATCTEDGLKTSTCANCGDAKTETVPATGHSYSGFVVTKEATCTEDGLKTSTCANCGDAQMEAIPALGHSYGPATVVKEATCTEDGLQTAICSRCDSEQTEAIPALGHSYGPAAVVKEATCTEDGTQTAVCSRCGDTRTETIPALGHSYGQVIVTKGATCLEDGSQTSTCSRCSDVLTEVIPAKGHDLVPTAGGEYECANERNPGGESLLAVTTPMRDGYLAVKAQDGHRAPYAYQNVASAQRHVSDLVRSVLESAGGLLNYTITTIRFTPPTETVDGEYIYRVTIRSAGRAAASSITTEPLRMVIPAGSGADPDPVPDPRPETEDTYYIAVLKADGGQVIPNVRYAAQGDRVTVSTHPDGGYELSELTVTDIRGRSLTVRELGENRFSFTMPNVKVEISAVFTALEPAGTSPSDEIFTGLGTPGISGIVLNPSPMPFTDVPPSRWYYNSVDYVWKHYLMSGVSDTLFAPGQTTSRAMIWTILARMHNVRTDINPGSTWYEKGMLWAVEKGVTDGANPMGDITREQLAVMLWRDAGGAGGGSDLSRFSDASSVSSYAVNAVSWAVSRGILQGSNGLLNPSGTAARAEIAAMIMRYAGNR